MEKIRHTLQIIANFIKDILYKKKLIIFVGKHGIKINAYHKRNLINNIFIDHNDPELMSLYQAFLKNHPKFHVSFLLDSEECQLKHEFMPMLQTIIKFNPVEKFIEENYKPEDIVAYNIYNIDHKNGEVWEAIVASCPYSANISKWIEFVTRNSFALEGLYFLSLEFEPIANEVLERKTFSEYQNDLQIFVSITQVSGIRIATKHQKNILEEIIVPFPFDKSDLYIVGTIEQAISDIVLKYKGYVKNLELNICLIFACDAVLCELLLQSTLFQTYKIVTYNKNVPLSSPNEINPHFQDDNLLELFMESKKYLALNKKLRAIIKLTTFDSVIFKPLIMIMTIIIVILGVLKYQSHTIQNETTQLNNKYYLLSEKYRNIKKRHPNVENITNLADLYNFQAMLNMSSPMPFEALKKVFSVKNPNVNITSITWGVENPQLNNRQTELQIEVVYTNSKKDMKLATELLNNYVKEMKLVFKDSKVNYVYYYDNLIELSKKLTIPAKITIKGSGD